VVLSGRINLFGSSPRKIHTPAHSGVSGKRAVRGHRSVYETLKGGISRSALIAGSHRDIGVSALSLLSTRLAKSHRGLIMYSEGGYPPLNPFRNRRPAWLEGTFESLNESHWRAIFRGRNETSVRAIKPTCVRCNTCSRLYGGKDCYLQILWSSVSPQEDTCFNPEGLSPFLSLSLSRDLGFTDAVSLIPSPRAFAFRRAFLSRLDISTRISLR
jgi:hypothetical protein